MVLNLSTVLCSFLSVMAPLFTHQCSWFNFRFVTPQWYPKGGNLWCSAAGNQCFSFSRTLHLGEFLPSWGSFEFRPSNWRTIAVLMLHYFHPNATLLLILLGRHHFFGYYAPVFIVYFFLSAELWLSQTFADTLSGLRLQPEKKNLWIVFCSACISINAPGKVMIFSLEFLKVLFSVPSPKSMKMVKSRTKEGPFPIIPISPVC